MLEFKVKLTKCSGKPTSKHWLAVDGTLTMEVVYDYLQMEAFSILSDRKSLGFNIYLEENKVVLEKAVDKAIAELGYEYDEDHDGYPFDMDEPWDETLSSDPENEPEDYHANHKHFVTVVFLPSSSIPKGIV